MKGAMATEGLDALPRTSSSGSATPEPHRLIVEKKAASDLPPHEKLATLMVARERACCR